MSTKPMIVLCVPVTMNKPNVQGIKIGSCTHCGKGIYYDPKMRVPAASYERWCLACVEDKNEPGLLILTDEQKERIRRAREN